MTDDISVLLVDDQDLFREGVKVIVDAQDGMTVVGTAGDGVEAVRLVEELTPDVVLMDVRMPQLDGIEATRRITSASDDHPAVLVLTTFDDEEYVLGAVRAGAAGFLLKDSGPDVLVSAVRTLAGSRVEGLGGSLTQADNAQPVTNSTPQQA